MGSAPSTPAPHPAGEPLEGPDTQADITEINSTMSRYLREGRFQVHPDAVFTSSAPWTAAKVRRGLVGRIDLEQYDYEPGPPPHPGHRGDGALPASRPGWQCGKTPPSSCPHVMLLADHPGRTVIEPLSGQTAEMRPSTTSPT